ncbi:hypothetical protein [Herbiconiux ginsengi]|uniref:Uncharacterized protein n=1 Tax=Herbiconiux ginsengi TaxID=381665 RepID=A0A1H3LYV0_9MICO|nr:hypothetical protein [Herbiconiux ginsengi]SDY69717.1 hypothetical protein SAMN05216554_1202 [Herbiconiux ginsengi]
MLTAAQTRALTDPIDRRRYGEYRRRTRPPGRRLWPRVLGLLGTCALIVFLSLYVTDWNVDLAPWFAIGIAVLFALSAVLVRRATSRGQRMRYRLDQFARDNGYRLEHDVADPGTPGLLFRLGTKPVTLLRMTPSSHPGEWEVGIHARTEVPPAGSTTVVETLYVMAASPTPRPRADPPGSVPPVPSVSTPATPPTLDGLPQAGVLVGEGETDFCYEDLGDRTICYLAEVLDLADPRSWARIAAVENWIVSPRP